MVLINSTITCFATDIITANSDYYYEMNGGNDIGMPPVTRQQEIRLGGDINTHLGFVCDGFNPSVSVSNSINNIKNSVQGLSRNVISSATAAVGSMPMYMLSKSNKDLYNLIQNSMTNAENRFNISMKSCQNALDDIKHDKSPYQNWFSVSDSQGWLNYARQAKQGQDVDINTASQQITKDPKKYGIPWVHKGQNSAGTTGNQVAIKVIYDVVVAGYNVMVDPQLPLDAKTTLSPTNTALARYWQASNTAGNWARLVLGDFTISAKDNDDQTIRGTDLFTIVQTCPQYASNKLTCAKTIAKNLTTLVRSHIYPTVRKLKAVSSNELLATPALIIAIHNKGKTEQSMAINKWSQDVALQNIVDQALLLRQLLIAGSQTKPVHNLKPALSMIQNADKQLDTDIKNILFRFKVRQALMRNTASMILNDHKQNETKSVGKHISTQQPKITSGAVYKKNV